MISNKESQVGLETDLSIITIWPGYGGCNSFRDPFKHRAVFLAGHLWHLCIYHCQKVHRPILPARVSGQPYEQRMDHGRAYSAIQPVYCKPSAGGGNDGIHAASRFPALHDGAYGSGGWSCIRVGAGIVRVRGWKDRKEIVKSPTKRGSTAAESVA
jgi:hypothetical protein